MGVKSYAEQRRDRPRCLSTRERLAVQLLHKDGWTIGELTMTMHVGERAIRRIINQRTEGDQ